MSAHTRQDAEYRLALAGREMGGGLMVAVERLIEKKVIRLRAMPKHHPDTPAKVGKTLEQMREAHDERERQTAIGIAIGLLMCEDEDALAVVEEIRQEWREGKFG